MPEEETAVRINYKGNTLILCYNRLP